MPRVYWKTMVIVFVLAFGARWALKHWKPADSASSPLALTHVEESEEETIDAAEELHSTTADAPVPEKSPAGTSQGPLTFDQDPVELKPRPEDEEISTRFTFTNTSGKPVTITRLESTCSCLEASLDQRTYAPGAKGSGEALFKVTSFVGRHEKTVHLFTDDPEHPEQVLTFILDVPVVVSIEPNFVEWAIGDPPTPKHMTFKMLGPDPLRITNITPTRENVTYELAEVAPGREYRLTLTPKSTEVITMGGLKIETDSKIPKYARQMAFFSISRPELIEKRKREEEKEKEQAAKP